MLKLRHKRSIVVPVIIVAIALVAGGGWYWSNNRDSTNSTAKTPGSDTSANNDKSTNNDPPTTDEKTTGDSIKQDTASSSEESNNTSANSPQSVTVSITSADKFDDVLKVRTLIQALNNSGTCKLTLSKSSSATVTKTSGVQALASSSTCKGFDISTKGLAAGQWKLSINFSSSKYRGSASQLIAL